MLKADEIIKLKRYCQEIIEKPRPMDKQPSRRDTAFLWCEDWEIIETLKYLFLGREVYMAEAPPNRLKRNPLWLKESIADQADALFNSSSGVDEVIEKLREKRDGATLRVAGHS